MRENANTTIQCILNAGIRECLRMAMNVTANEYVIQMSSVANARMQLRLNNSFEYLSKQCKLKLLEWQIKHY